MAVGPLIRVSYSASFTQSPIVLLCLATSTHLSTVKLLIHET